LTHRRNIKSWFENDGRVILHNGDETVVTTRVVVDLIQKTSKRQLLPEYRLPPVNNIGSTEDGGFISNLIVTVPAESVIRSLSSILHRIRPTTVICLLQDGLGVAEALNDACFPDPVNQPMYVFGHMTHVLRLKRNEAFGLSELRQGKLYLSAIGHEVQRSDIKYHPPVERRTPISHFLDIMATTPRLQAGGYTYEYFMAEKLQVMISQSVLEPLTVVLDCTFDELWQNSYARQMIDLLLGEILSVVARLPEIKDSPDLRWMILYGEMRKHVLRRLAASKDLNSRMRTQTHRGLSSDIDYLNGYFVQRGRELGIKCPVNESVMWMVKAKHDECLRMVRSEVELQPMPDVRIAR
jgi:ketopantoate reductase